MKHDTNPLQILIAEENDTDFNFITDCLNNIGTWKFDIKRVRNYEALTEELNTTSYDVCLCDGDICCTANNSMANLSIEGKLVMVLSSKNDCKAAWQELKPGVLNCLSKDELNAATLEASIFFALTSNAAVKKIQKEEKIYKRLFEKSRDIIFLASDNYEITTINYAVKEILGFDETSCIGKPFLHLFSNSSAASHFSAALKQHGEITNYEADMLTTGEQPKTCAISASIETTGDNQEYLQGTIRDISHLKTSETAYIQSEKLAAAGRFILTLAHELRNPLNNIKLAVENLSQVNFNEEDSFFLGIIKKNADRINNHVTELLVCSRPAEVKLEDLLLHNLLDKLIDQLKERLQQRNISLAKHYADADLSIKGDAEKLSAAFLNIFENALEAVEDGAGNIDVETVNNADKISIYITDNGCGISDENKSKIFEPYFTSKRSKSGMGLTKTLNILESHHSKIAVDSKVNDGTTFCIQFPF